MVHTNKGTAGAPNTTTPYKGNTLLMINGTTAVSEKLQTRLDREYSHSLFKATIKEYINK